MRTITLKYQNGQFVPIGDIPILAEGEELAVMLPNTPPDWDAYLEMLDKTAGIWADMGDEFADAIDEARQTWDEEWQKKLNSL